MDPKLLSLPIANYLRRRNIGSQSKDAPKLDHQLWNDVICCLNRYPDQPRDAQCLSPATAILLFFDKLSPGLKGMKRIWLRNKQDAVWERVLRAVTWVEDHPNNIAWELSKWGWDP